MERRKKWADEIIKKKPGLSESTGLILKTTKRRVIMVLINPCKRIITIAAIMISPAVYGQDTLKPKAPTEHKRLLFGVNISPDYCYRTIKDNGEVFGGSMIIDMKNQYEEFKIGYTVGLNICYNISKNFGIESGVQYSNKGYAFGNQELTFGDMVDPRFGFTYATSNTAGPTKVKFIYNYIYLDVPVRAIFSFGEKRVRFTTSVGVTTNIFLKATNTNVLEYENGDTKRKTYDQSNNFKPLNISPTISAGVDYKISNKINLRAEPTFRYGFLKIVDSSITTYLWSGGINLTCYYALK